MPVGGQRQRQWKSQAQQQALLEYGLVQRACPEGIYLSLTPDNYALWSGVLFVRKGPYAPAILRFQIAFPQRYPEIPPLVLFTSEVFHPLVTPQTTYTYTTGSKSTDTVSATDEERLLPGGFSLRHGFSRWFEKTQQQDPAPLTFKDIKAPVEPTTEDSATASESDDHETPPKSPQKPPIKGLQPIHMPPPKDEGGFITDLSPSIIEVLRYMQKVFEDDALLDDLPLEAAGNPSAWHAWQAHRRRIKGVRNASDSKSSPNTPQKGSDLAGRGRPTGQWNWDGVWSDRVKRGVGTSLSEAMLYGGVDNDDLVHFLDVEQEVVEGWRAQFSPLAKAVAQEPSTTPTEG